MSYDLVKYISVNKKECRIFVTSACSNVSPKTFEKWEFDSKNTFSFANKVLKLAQAILDGELKPYASCNHKKLIKDMQEARNGILSKIDIIGKDFQYRTNMNYAVNDFIGRKLAVPYFNGEQYNLKEIKNYLCTEFYETCLEVYRRKQAEYDSKGQLLIRSASSIPEFPDWLMLISYDDQVYVAKRDKYKSGLLDNSDGSAIHLKDRPSQTYKDTWEILRYWEKAFALKCFPELKAIEPAIA